MHDDEAKRSHADRYSRSVSLLAAPIDPVAGVEPIAVPLGRVVAILRRHLWVILLVFVIGVSGAAYVVRGMPKLYTAQASLIIEPQRTQVSDLQAITADPEGNASLMLTQIGILTSRSLALGVVAALHLTQYPEFSPRADGLPARVKMWFVKHHLLWSPVAAPLTQEERAEISAAILSNKLSFSNQAESRILSIAVTTLNPRLSATIANEVAKQFLVFKVQEKFAAIQRAHDWLQRQVAALSQHVRADDAAVEAYRLSHNLGEVAPENFDPGAQSGPPQTVNRQQLNAISTQLVDIERGLSEKEGELVQARAALRGEISTSDLPAVLSSPLIAQLSDEMTAATGRVAGLAASEGIGNPQLRAARARVVALQDRTHAVMESIAKSLSIQVAAAEAQRASLQQQLERLRSAVSAQNRAQVGLNTLEARARATRDIYQSFLTRAAQLANVAGIQEPDASLVSSAQPPLSPSAPKKGRILVIAGVLSLALGTLLAVLLERIRTGFSLPEQVESTTGLPIVALMPKVRGMRFHRRRSDRAEIAMTASLDRLRGQLQVMGPEQPRLLMVTSALPKEGKSLFSAEFAGNMAAAGRRVLLLECDFCRPSLAACFGLSESAGLCEMLSGRSLGRRDRLVHQPIRNLDVILAGRQRGSSQELLTSPRMEALLLDARARYDFVIMDTPPVLAVSDALVLGRLADATLAVVHWEKTPRDAVTNAINLLRGGGVLLMGAVMTRVDIKKAVIFGGRMSYAFRQYDGYRTTVRV
jgi:capsular exopolysaccharide synthesis family protein